MSKTKLNSIENYFKTLKIVIIKHITWQIGRDCS